MFVTDPPGTGGMPIGASGTACSVTITQASETGLAGSMRCPSAKGLNGDYVYSIAATFSFAP